MRLEFGRGVKPRVYSVNAGLVSSGVVAPGFVGVRLEEVERVLKERLEASVVVGGGLTEDEVMDVQMDVWAYGAEEALRKAVVMCERAYREVQGFSEVKRDGLLGVCRADVLLREEFKNRLLDGMSEERFCGVSEVAEILGLEGGKSVKEESKKWGFPVPVQVLDMGPLWREADIRDYRRQRR